MNSTPLFKGTLGKAKQHFIDLDSELGKLISEFGEEREITVNPITDDLAPGEAWLCLNRGGDVMPVLRVSFIPDKNKSTILPISWLRTEVSPVERPSTPPIDPEFLFYLFISPQNCDALVGDLEERYKLIHKKFGRRRADFWYWTQTVVSLGPIVWAWANKVLMKPVVAFAGWAVAKGLVGHDSWLAALVELWKRVRS